MLVYYIKLKLNPIKKMILKYKLLSNHKGNGIFQKIHFNWLRIIVIINYFTNNDLMYTYFSNKNQKIFIIN